MSTQKKPLPLIRKVAGGLFAAVALCAPSNGAWGQTEDKVRIDGSTTVGPITKAFAEYYMRQHPDVNITVSESGSGNGAKSLVNGTCDAAAMSRFMKPQEFSAAVDKGVMPVAHVVAIDGIAIVVHPSNPMANLTVSQVRDIYAGKITNWSQVGGPDKKIVAISRDSNSGTFECFNNLVMQKEKIAGSTEYVGSNGAARQRVQSTPGAVGYVGLGFLDRTVKALSVDNVHPDPDSVTSGRYPVARPLYLFTDGYPELGSHLHAFVTLHLSRKGQEIIESLGFVPVTHYK
ncbi:MAG: phosphate ABC transporter substrate-binding protein [Phycisphaerales bacterium]|nr:MAG: phosphate ABC transporter substrate-binding protein [Phycisphaerales bacterium]